MKILILLMEGNIKMNILHIAYLSNSKTSGVGVVVPKYLEYESKYEKVCLLNCNEEYNLENKQDNYKMLNIKDIENYDLSNLEKPFDCPDLVIFHAIYYPIYINLYKQLTKRKIPYIIVPHGSLGKQAQLQKPLKKWGANLLLFNKFIKNSIAIQYLCQQEAENSIFNKKYIIAGNGVEIDNKKIDYNKKKDEFIITYIGRYDYLIKGLDVLIEACNLIKDEMRKNKIKLKMFGSDYKNRIKKIQNLIKKYNISDIVELNGPVFENEKIKQLMKSDIFIQTSRSEGQSMGIIEAISLGLPCIFTPGTNFGEIVEKNHFGYCCKLNKEDISKKIIIAYENKKELPKMSINAINYANKNFAWDFVIKNTMEKYREVLNEKN